MSNYKLKQKISRTSTTTNVGNSVYNIGSSTSDRFNQIWSATFRGDTTGSYYADLAEKYTVDPNIQIPVGTVMEVSSGKYDSEVCMTELSKCVIGIISEKPGYIMNEGLENSALIGLTGTVPARVIGPVVKKDILVSAGGGCLRAAKTSEEKNFKIAVAIESNSNMEEKLIKCIVK